jgi:beta-glucosidase
MGNVKSKPKGSGGDRVNLHLPEEDVALIKALAKCGKKLIVNIMGGSAYIINDWINCADAVMMSFYSGLEGGNALADVISGDKNFGGKLPFTIAKRAEDYPDFLHIGAENKEIEYGYYHGYTLFEKNNIEPDYPFGFGLSYTDFEIKNADCTKAADTLTVTAEVTNTCATNGDEVLQVYVGSNRTDIDRPVKLLKGFKRIGIDAGKTVNAQIDVEIEDLKFYDPESGNWLLDSEYTVYLGTSSSNASPVTKIQF